MPEKVKLTYFNIQGLAESVRYILAYAGVDFEDVRITKEEWATRKESMPYKKLPFIEVDGKLLNQSTAICRYLGQKHGLEHKDLWTRSQLEALIDNIKDLHKKIVDVMQLKTPEAKQEFDTAQAELFSQLELIAAEGYFYGSKATWVDVYFTGVISTLETHFGDLTKPYPNLTALVGKVKSNEKLSNYLKTRAPLAATMG